MTPRRNLLEDQYEISNGNEMSTHRYAANDAKLVENPWTNLIERQHGLVSSASPPRFQIQISNRKFDRSKMVLGGTYMTTPHASMMDESQIEGRRRLRRMLEGTSKAASVSRSARRSHTQKQD